MDKISMVIPYVDNTDKVWLKIYNKYCIENNLREKIIDIHTDRYEDIGLINYQLKLINKHMPWIDNIYLLLMNRQKKGRKKHEEQKSTGCSGLCSINCNYDSGIR